MMTNIAMENRWPIEIDGLPWFTELKNGPCSMAMLNDQRDPEGTSSRFPTVLSLGC